VGSSGTFAAARRDPVLLGFAGFTLLSTVALFLLAGDSARQVHVFWAAQVPFDAMLAVGAWRMRKHTSSSFLRFWTMIAFAGASFTVGDTYQSVLVLLDPGVPTMNGGVVQSAFFVVGMSSNVIACMIFPQGLRTRREKSIFWLDATTVLVGGAVMAWCFAVNPFGGAPTDRVTASLTAALVVVAAFSATKVALIPAPPMARIAAWPMVAAASVQGISTFLPGPFQEATHAWVFAIRLLPSLLIAVGPRIQELHVRHGGTDSSGKRRPYSLLPYGMIAVTFVTFFSTLSDPTHVRLWGAAAGVVLITCLVIGRQLYAFHDNMTLIGQLDTALDELRDHEVLLREQAAVDGLTKLSNRTHFSDEMSRVLTTAEESAVLLIDLDDFKTINDTMGHAAGDALLVVVATRLREAVRAGDIVARLGGDEFAILLPGADMDDAGRVADEILRRLATPTEVQQHTVVTRASIGLAVARPGDAPSILLSSADIAMYEAKHRGKNTWVRYSEEMGARIGAEAVLIRELGRALEQDEFSLLYQPIVRLADNKLIGAEALIRWNHPSRGLVSPAEFIPVAERTGQIVPIGRWAMREACRQAALWLRNLPEADHFTIGVNVAGRQLQTPGFVTEVADVLHETGLPARYLNIEVTETAVLDDEQSHEALNGLRALGVRLALDDFGTAASSLGLLLTTPMTALKLDRSFVESITTVGRQAAVATAVSQMASALALDSVAEGIETAEQRALLQGLGYQYGQGYHFSRPVPPEQIEEHLAAVPVT
jgi:diguanylate cyclase (GGDEF)-like protein